MRVMMRATIPVEQGNKALKDGTLRKVVQSALQELKPEAAYFFPFKGKRTALFVFDLKDPSQIPVIAEPLFSALHAEIEYVPVMNAEDLQAGLEALARRG
jgi:hypothetical protein